jgi:hypothetical protein
LKILKQWGTDFAFEVERIVHYELRDHRLSGEWFNCSLDAAVHEIQKVMAKTRRGRDLSCYREKKNLVKSIAAQKAGNASGKKAKAKSAKGVAKIMARWSLPHGEWPTQILLDEADVSLNTAKLHLGPRPIAQYKHQTMLKRKAKDVRYKRADRYIDEVPDEHRN